jgi:hypothetical protein
MSGLDKLRGHELLPQEIRDKLPPLYSQDSLGLQALAIVKFFTPDSSWTWYVSEGSPVDANGYMDTHEEKVDFLLFGLVAGFEMELGYFSLGELETITGPRGRPIERDLNFNPDTLGNLQRKHSRR